MLTRTWLLLLILFNGYQEPAGRERVYNGGGLELLTCITLSWKVSEALAAFMPITLIVEVCCCERGENSVSLE